MGRSLLHGAGRINVGRAVRSICRWRRVHELYHSCCHRSRSQAVHAVSYAFHSSQHTARPGSCWHATQVSEAEPAGGSAATLQQVGVGGVPKPGRHTTPLMSQHKVRHCKAAERTLIALECAVCPASAPTTVAAAAT